MVKKSAKPLPPFVEETARNLADQTIRKLFPKLKNTDGALHNLVLYWGDEACDLIYVNNPSLISKNSKQIKKLRQTNDEWLDGTPIEVELFSVYDIPRAELAKQLPYKENDVYLLMAVMDAMVPHLVEALKKQPFQGQPKVEDDIAVLAVFHDIND